MSANAILFIPSGSAVSLNGISVADQNGTLQDNTNSTLYVTVVDANGTTTANAQQASYNSTPGSWTYLTATGVFVRGNGDWTITWQLYDANGSGGGNLRRTWVMTGKDTEQ